MLKKASILLLMFCISAGLFAQACDLFFSEYVEGSSNNKYLEIYNGTGATVNLSDYRIDLFSNGATTPSNSQVLSGTLANGQVVVYANNGATIYAGTVILPGAIMSFNGDDAIGLYKISLGTYVDVFGNIGCDPGTDWSSGGNATKDHTLVRDANVCCGTPIDSVGSSCNFPTLATEWTEYPQDDVSHLGSHTANCVCTPAAEPTSNTTNSTITVNDCSFSANISLTAGNGAKRIVVISASPITNVPSDQTHYDANDTLGLGDSIGGGQYVVYNGTGNTTNTVVLNNGTYYLAVFEYNGATNDCEENYLTTGYYTDSFTILCTCPQIKMTMVNTCGASSQEGVDEYLKINTEGTALNLDTLQVTFPFGGTFCNTSCGSKTIVNNAAYVSQLNTTAGCSLFTYSNIVPSGRELLIFTGNPPNFNYDFSGSCGNGPIYVAFANNNLLTGRYANASNTNRTTSVYFNATCSDSATYYSSTANTGVDGDYVAFNNIGEPTYGNYGMCAVPLPLQIIDFKGKNLSGQNILQWKYSGISDVNNVVLLKSDGNQPFKNTANFQPKENINQYFTDDAPYDITYYKLNYLDANGKTIASKTIAVSSNANNQFFVFPNPVKQGNKINISFLSNAANINISLYDIIGKKMKNILTTHSNQAQISYKIDLQKGIYFLKYSDGKTLQIRKIVVY